MAEDGGPPRDGTWQKPDDAVVTESERKLDRPRQYRVVLLNDDYTTMEFVVMILMSVFNHTEARAVELMLHVHNHGSAVAGVYSHEVAETKVKKVTELARQNEFPLRCAMEPE